MAEIFRLEELFPENALSKEQNINFHKALSMGESFAKKNVRPNNCLICNSSKNPFCNSHSVPARCLRAIAINGDVKVFNGLVKIPAVDDDKGVNEAGTFKLICRECDNKAEEGQVFNLIRKTTGLSIKEMAEILTIKSDRYSYLEKNGRPSLQEMIKLYDILGINPGLVISGRCQDMSAISEMLNIVKGGKALSEG